jgi:ABC-type branched-subunit amino acid transport system substrate-binding protein
MTSTGGVLVGGVVSLSGRYAFQGRLAGAGLQQAVADVRSSGGVRLGDRTVLPELVVSTMGARVRACVMRWTR